MVKAADRRKRGRVNLQGALCGTLGLSAEVRVINLSLGGAMIEHRERLSPDQPCLLGLRLAGLDLRLRARVVWSRAHSAGRTLGGESEVSFRSGLQFTELPEGAEVHLRQYLARLRAPKAASMDEGE